LITERIVQWRDFSANEKTEEIENLGNRQATILEKQEVLTGLTV
jgi:hypothetical protein